MKNRTPIAGRPPRWPRILLQLLLTAAAVLLVTQSITAGLFLAQVRPAFPVHRDVATAAGIALMVGVVAGVLCVRLRGERWHPVWMAIGLLALMSLQAFAGYRSLTALHVPLGVLTIAAGAAVAAWSWRPVADSSRARQQPGERVRSSAQ